MCIFIDWLYCIFIGFELSLAEGRQYVIGFLNGLGLFLVLVFSLVLEEGSLVLVMIIFGVLVLIDELSICDGTCFRNCSVQVYSSKLPT